MSGQGDGDVTVELEQTASDAVRVLVVDDHRTFAELLAAGLESAGMTAVGVAHTANQAVSLSERLQPDVVVMDIQMPQQDGLTATRRIREVAPDSVIAIVTAHRDPDWVVRSAQAGASAFIPKDASLDEMIDVLRRARAGQMLVAPSTFASRTADPDPDERFTEPVPSLTRREREVLDCVAQGMQVKAISRVLGISHETGRGYVKTLHVKLGARSQLEAVLRAQRFGLLGAPRAD
jgi:DNA-binding NarL/FixJ family response regulator